VTSWGGKRNRLLKVDAGAFQTTRGSILLQNRGHIHENLLHNGVQCFLEASSETRATENRGETQGAEASRRWILFFSNDSLLNAKIKGTFALLVSLL
jgi:hypothetical protein